MPLDAKAVMRRMGTLKSARTTHESHWQEVADYTIPSRQFTRGYSPGAKRNTLIFNTHPVLANEQLAGGLHGMLVSPALRWFALRPLPHMARDSQVREWFDAATTAMFEHMQSPRSGFAAAMHEGFLDIAAFGNGTTFIADRGLRGPRYQAIPLLERYIAENDDGEIDTLYRSYQMAAREIVRRWPGTAPERVRKTAETQPDAKIEIIHATEPDRSGASRSAAGAGSQAWATSWLCGQDVLEESRFREFPFAAARWAKRSGEVDGAGPGMNALPDVKMLNKAEETHIRGMAKAVDPATFMPSDGFLNMPNLNPAANNYYDIGQWRGQNPIFTMPAGNPQLAHQYIELIQGRISDLYYVTWLRLPQQPNMTATEVLQRRDELLRLLGPMVSRLEAELLGPCIERSFAIMLRNGLFPPLPPQLRGQGWGVEYLGPLSRAQRQADADTVMRWFASMQPLVQADPDVLLAIDTDEAARFLADRHGAPTVLVRSPEELARIRADRANAQAAQAQAVALREGAGAAKDGASAIATLAGIEGGMEA